jgi:hypothetical protein
LNTLGLQANQSQLEAELKQFHGKLFGTFLSFAEDAFLEWVTENGLQSRE